MTTLADHAHDAVEEYDGDVGALIRDALAYLGHESRDSVLDRADVRFDGELGHAALSLQTYNPHTGVERVGRTLQYDHPITRALAAVLRAADRACD